MKRRLATLGHEQRGRSRSQVVDVRRTMRSSLETGGVPLRLRYRPKRPRRPEIYVLCDVSTSVTSASVFFLSVLHALHDSFRKLRTFVFIERISEVTDVFEHERDFAVVAQKISSEGGVADVSGYTDYGRVWLEFLTEISEDLDPRSTVIVLGDARTNGREPHAEVFAQVAERAGRLFWLNPEPKLYWNYGDSVMAAYERYCDGAFECWTTRHLENFVDMVAGGYPPAGMSGRRALFLRHGESAHNAHTGSEALADEDGDLLTEVGQAQARAAAAGVAALELGVDRLLTSPMRRARETADALGERRWGSSPRSSPTPTRWAAPARPSGRRSAGCGGCGPSSRGGPATRCRCLSPTASSSASSSSTRCSASASRSRWCRRSGTWPAPTAASPPSPAASAATPTAAPSPAGPASAGWSGRGIGLTRLSTRSARTGSSGEICHCSLTTAPGGGATGPSSSGSSVSRIHSSSRSRISASTSAQVGSSTRLLPSAGSRTRS